MKNSNIINQIKHFIRSHNLIEKNDRILVAVSGGKDSIILLDILSQLQSDLDFSLAVAHVNHNLRKDSKKDALFVERLARKYKLPFYYEDVCINKKGASLEEKARNARYTALEIMRKFAKASKIAVAHTKDDNAETLIFRFLAGSALHGLSGIQAVNDKIIRPLLCLDRALVNQYSKNTKLTFHEDSTNENNKFTRNRIRNVLIPILKKDYNQNIIETLNESSYLFSESHAFFRSVAQKIIDKHVQKNTKEFTVSLTKLKKYPKIYWYYILREMLNNFIDFKKIRFAALRNFIERLQSIQKHSDNFSMYVSKDIILCKKYDMLTVLRRLMHKKDMSSIVMSEPGYSSWNGKQLLLQVTDYNDKIINNMDMNALYFDYDTIDWPLTVRTMQRGDRFQPLGLQGSKKLSDFFIDKKVEKEKRVTIPLFISANTIIGVFNYTIAEEYKIKKTTKRILKISLGGHRETIT